MNKLPWVSLIILFAAYSTFSWFLTHANVTWLAWGLVLAFTLLQALLLTTLFDGVKLMIGRWLKSDVGYFTLIIVVSLSVTIALVWFKIFGYFLVLVAAEILVRLDLQNSGFNRLQALLILSFFSLCGLAVGWLASTSSFLGSSVEIKSLPLP
ncbi:MAG TPA: hypothetical protein V6C65_38065 [Allocoleopsis sp.]